MAYIGTTPKDIRSFGKAKFDFTATQGQTAFTGLDDDGKTLGFTTGQITVYLNGILLDESDYTASGSNTVTLASAANAGDILSVVALQTDIPNSDYVPATGGTFSGAVVADSTVTVNGAVVANDGLTINNDAATVLTVDRATDEGSLVDFKKDGITIGAIGTGLSSLSVGTGNTQLMFWNAQSGIFPSNGSTVTDNSINFGNPNYRFKDLYLSGKITYGANTIDGSGGLNVTSRYTYNDGNNNFVGTLNQGFTVLVISQGSGSIVLPFFQNAGGGVAWTGSLFDPDAGSFVYGNGPIVTFTAAGTNANTYRVQMVGGSGYTYVQRTAGSQAYSTAICVLLY